ncbi:MAG: M48 family metalloprotease [Paracoccaceae bacterium]
MSSTSRTRPSIRKWTLAVWLIVSYTIALPAHAITLLRDADIEYSLTQVATPVLRAAGLSPARVKILVVDDTTLNAFVLSTDVIFLNYGLIARLESAEMLQGVIAHEAAHIVNGHITRRLTNIGSARTAASLGLALAALAAAVGAGEAAPGIAIGASSAAQRQFFRHTRAEEASADQSALRFLKSANISPTGLLEVMQIFRGQELVSENRQDPYVRSHPLSRDRVRAVQSYVGAYGDGGAAQPDANYWFTRAKGKLTAFKRGPAWTLKRAKDSGYKDVRLMREAIAHHRNSRTKRSLNAIDQAIALRPNDPFLHDLKGEILTDVRQFKAATNSHAQAVKLRPRDGLLLAGYGRALLATGNATAARDQLERARSIDFRDGSMLRDLAQAYAKTGQPGMASLVTAEQRALRGRLEDAGIHAKRAIAQLPRGSGPWQRAQDVLIAAERSAKKKRR